MELRISRLIATSSTVTRVTAFCASRYTGFAVNSLRSCSSSAAASMSSIPDVLLESVSPGGAFNLSRMTCAAIPPFTRRAVSGQSAGSQDGGQVKAGEQGRVSEQGDALEVRSSGGQDDDGERPVVSVLAAAVGSRA